MWFCEEGRAIDEASQRELMARVVREVHTRFGSKVSRALLVPSDRTRFHSRSGFLANRLFHALGSGCHTDVMPALGQHLPHTPAENRWMFGDVPEERILVHDWKNSCQTVGDVSAEFVRHATGGSADWGFPIEIDRAVLDGGYDVVISIGQVVPHEVLGYANHNKNLIVGVGGKSTICASHLIAASDAIEDTLGQIVTPLRGCFNVAEREFLRNVPIVYILTVKTPELEKQPALAGLFVGETVETYVRAARFARTNSVKLFDEPLRKIVCFMDGKKFQSTWVANKAIYRTRMVLADGGELIVVAPGVCRFGEHGDIDGLIRKHGYRGTARAMQAHNSDPAMRDLGHTAAHLIHGSSEGRFKIVYAAGGLTREEVEGVGFQHMEIEEALRRYHPDEMDAGLNTVDGEDIFFIPSPSLGLWTSQERIVAALNKNRTFAERMIEWEPEETLWPQLKRWDEADIREYGGKIEV